MDDRERNGAPVPAGNGTDRLNSWKEIGAYLGRSVTTLQRWEASEGLPVHRLPHAKKGSVYAFRSELDAWWGNRSRDALEAVPHDAPPIDVPIPAPAPSMMLRNPLAIRTAVSAAIVILAVTVVGLTWTLARVRGPVPETPTHFDVRTPEPGTVILLWTAPSSTGDRFEIRQFGTVVGTVPPGVTRAEFTGLDAGKSYHWDVRACNSSGCSPWHGIVGKTPNGQDASTGAPDLPKTGAPTDILFGSNRATGRSQIYVMRSDGSRVTRVTNSSVNDWSPAWSPDRTRIAFNSDRSGTIGIYVMQADGSAIVNLTLHDPSPAHEPAWSPDGKQIAFSSTRAGDTDVWVMNADGSNPVNLTRSPGEDAQPAWSLDGSRIAFSSSRNGAHDVYVMNADGSNQRRLTTDGADDTSPAWGPGDRIAFQSVRDGNNQIYLIDADGSHETRVTNHLRNDRSPTWSPDGTRIVFGSDRDGNPEIYSVKPDGSELLRLTKFPGVDTDPAWGLLRTAVRARR